MPLNFVVRVKYTLKLLKVSKMALSVQKMFKIPLPLVFDGNC